MQTQGPGPRADARARFCAVVAIIAVVLPAGAARAQVTYSLPGYGPNDGMPDYSFSLFPDYEQTRSLAQIERDLEIERQYKEVLRKIPDRKASNDPWKTIRKAPPTPDLDRHRPQ